MTSYISKDRGNFDFSVHDPLNRGARYKTQLQSSPGGHWQKVGSYAGCRKDCQKRKICLQFCVCQDYINMFHITSIRSANLFSNLKRPLLDDTRYTINMHAASFSTSDCGSLCRNMHACRRHAVSLCHTPLTPTQNQQLGLYQSLPLSTSVLQCSHFKEKSEPAYEERSPFAADQGFRCGWQLHFLGDPP